MKRKSVPSYLPHNQSGKARAVWTDSLGIRRQKLLPGKFESAESRAAFARLVLELASSPTAAVSQPGDLTVAEVLLAFLVHAGNFYDSKEVGNFKYAIRPVRELYADLPAHKFGPLALRAVRQQLVENGYARTLINQRVDRIKRIWRWAVSEELVPPASYEALRSLAGLQKGRTEARETEPVKPVDDAVVEKTLPKLPPHVRVMVQLMRFTGMRPSEVCKMTLEQIDRSGETWLYKPTTHKTMHKGKDRVIPLGPRARAELVEYLRGKSLDPSEPLFSPARQREERFAKLRAGRKTKVQPSQTSRKKSKPKRAPANWYRSEVICRAVALAASKAEVPRW